MIRFISFCLLIVAVLSFEAKSQMTEILGVTSATEIKEANRIFDIYTDRYEPNEAALEFLTSVEDSISIKVIFGTWCHDSKREIPAFIKTMEMAENPKIDIEYIGVNREKTDPEGRAEAYNLQYTPTFIIFRAENEIGRIVEESTESIEQDLVQILKSGNFKDN